MELNRNRSDSLNPVSMVPETSLSVIGEGRRWLAILWRNLSRLLSRFRGTSAKITQTFSRVLIKNTVLSLRLPMMRKVAALALRFFSESQPRVFLCFLSLSSGIVQQIEGGIAAVASSPIWGWDNGLRLLVPLRFLNTFEEQLLRHRRPRVPLSSEDSTIPRRVRKLPFDGSRLPVDDVSIFEHEYGNNDIRDEISATREPLCTCCTNAIRGIA